ncbi:MAG TPA: hypothetical protein VL860_02735, partial [Planctomycetota bacterium]|nr:hypothetical protein [Planctomycetota bacterium]
MRSGSRKLVFLLCSLLAVSLVGRLLPAPEYEQVAGTEVEGDPENSTGIYAKDAPKHTVMGSTKLKAQVYAGADIHFDSNIMVRHTDEQSSVVFAGILGGRLAFDGERFVGSLLAQVNGKAYSGFANLDGVTGHADAKGKYSISDSTDVSLEDLFQYLQDPMDIAQDVRAERVTNNLTGIFDT